MTASSVCFASIVSFAKLLFEKYELITQLTKRDITSRYKGTLLGVGWSLLSPLLLLSVYTFVFAFALQNHWPHSEQPENDLFFFATVLFLGLILHTLFTEVLVKAPVVITSNMNFVKKVVFPLELLPLIVLLGALFHFFCSIGIWLFGYFIFFGLPPVTAFMAPLLLVPLFLMLLGFSFFLAALGVYMRDVGQVMVFLATVMLFMAPVFFPLERLAPDYQFLMYLNPLTYFVEETRNLMLFNKGLNFSSFLIATVVSTLVFYLGFSWFQKTRRGFADVV